MSYRVNPLLTTVAVPPIPEAQGWIAGRSFPADKPLIDVAQAVPGYPPPKSLTDHLAKVIGQPQTARYTDVPGRPELRAALAADVTASYGGRAEAAQVTITAGCNQAFCFAVAALAQAGDEVILPLPYYFNHQMWLDMAGVTAVHLPFRPDRDGVPDPEEAAGLISPRTRAIVLVTPNNPTGAVYPPAVLKAFYELAKRHRIALILDETYRDFLPGDAAPHALFGEPDWPETLVQLYSFSKVFCITGYRVGAILAGRTLTDEVMKVMDTVAICAPNIGQEAALFGLEHLDAWRRGNRQLMRDRLAALRQACARNDLGYRLVSAGAYFAYVAHPFSGRPALQVARRLADEQNLLALPGSYFGPGQEDYLRVAFANVEADAMPAIAQRLATDAAKG